MVNRLHEYIESLSLEEREQYKELIHKALDRDAAIQYSREITEEYFKSSSQFWKKMEETLEEVEIEFAKLETLVARIRGEEIIYH